MTESRIVQSPGRKAVETKGPAELKRAGMMMAWTKRNGKDDQRNPYARVNFYKRPHKASERRRGASFVGLSNRQKLTTNERSHVKKVAESLGLDIPVLFCYIGWATRYDGTEPIVGGHGYLKAHSYDCSESRAFARSRGGGYYECGIGAGSVPERLHVVFVATEPTTQERRIVGVYANARTEFHRTEVPGAVPGRPRIALWATASTKQAILIRVDRRPLLKAWEEGQGQRRWALRDSGRQYPALLRELEHLKRGLPNLAKKVSVNMGEDPTYYGEGLREGQQRQRLTRHRFREARLRRAKIAAALSDGNGRLICEVPGCGFDFVARYGELGYGYAHVHHLKPLANAAKQGRISSLDDLAIVCANCHSMIHYGGECRDMKTLIPRTQKRSRPKSSRRRVVLSA